MNSVNVSAEILRELGYIADNTNYLEKVLAYIRSLTKKASTQRGIAYVSLLEQLSDFQEYEAGWDGAEARPLNQKVVKNFKAVLGKASEEILQGWHLEPQTNGTLLLLNDSSHAGINLGSNDFSFFSVSNGDVDGKNHVRFSANNVIDTIKQLSL